MRLFVSIDLDGLDERVRQVQEPFAGTDGLRLVDPGQAHVTLKFLGDTPRKRLPEVEEALGDAVADAGVGPFEAAFGGLGAFPSRDYVSVVWMGVREGDEAMIRLHEAIEEHTTAIGFDPEEHDFTPHVTLARMDHAGGKRRVLQLLDERDPDGGRLRVEQVRLTESTLGPAGPEYETVAGVDLRGDRS
jgi:2'-5' RNA ligase